MAARLKILFITSWYPISTNPMQGIFIREHAKSISIYDDIEVIHLAGRSHTGKLWELTEETDPFLNDGIPTYRYTTRKIAIPGFSYLLFLYGIWRAFLTLRENGFRADIIHASIFTAGVPSVIIGKLYHIPVVITEHNSAFPRNLLSSIDIQKAHFAFQHANYVTVVSQALQKAIENYRIHANFVLIPNTVDMKDFYYDSSRSVNVETKLVFVGSLIPIKGLDILLEALSRITNRYWTLDILGDGSERSQYEILTKSYGLDKAVTFHGYQPHKKVAEFMRHADLFISASLWENFPTVLVEAQACGLPIVGTNIGGIPEIVYPGSGWLAKSGDAASLAETISLALDQIKTIDRQKISQNAECFSRQAVGQLFHNLYQKVLSN